MKRHVSDTLPKGVVAELQFIGLTSTVPVVVNCRSCEEPRVKVETSVEIALIKQAEWLYANPQGAVVIMNRLGLKGPARWEFV